jgi:SH3-like domain-containing protein
MTFPDGTKYLGDWQNDKPFGQGTLTSVGKFEYAGEFNNGVRHGHGNLETIDGKKYSGQWQNDVPHGLGKIIYPDGSEFVGQFENGRRNGEGEAIYTDGTKYIGQWADDLPNGQGVRIFPDGKQYSGEFRNGLMHGKGTMTMPDGSKFNGQWQGDVLVKKEEIETEPKFTAVDEVEGHVLAVVDDKPAEAKVVAAERDMVPEPVPTTEKVMVAEPVSPAEKVDVANSNADYASVNKNGVFIRSGPSTEYRVISSAYKGFPVQVIGSRDKWTQIKDFMGQDGWIYTPLLGNNNSAVVKATKANLRSGAGIQFAVVNQVEYGAVLMINNIKGDWYMVTTPGGSEGWLSRELVWPAGHLVVSSPASSKSVVVAVPEDLQPAQTTEVEDDEKAEKVEVVTEQATPPAVGSGDKQIAPVIVKEQQQEVQEAVVEKKEATAVRVAADEQSASVQEVKVVGIDSKTAEAKKETTYVSVSRNGRGANIRSEPLMSSEVLRSIPPGYPLVVVDLQDNWVLVEDFRERQGWVYSSLLSEPGTVVINVGKGNLRSEPGINSEIVSKLDYGIVMIIEETRGEWVKVSNPEGLVGWLHNEVIWP